MKCSTKFLTLLAVSSAFAYTIPMEKREDYDYSYLGTNPIFPIKKECNDIFEKYEKECTIDLGASDVNYEEICQVYNTKACQELYNINIYEIPECKSSEESVLTLLDSMLRITAVSLKTLCTKDENNKICPLHNFEAQIPADEDISDKEGIELINKALNDTCKSKVCTNAFIEYEKEMRDIQSDYINAIKKFDANGEIEDMIKNLGKVKRQFSVADNDLGMDETLSKTIEFLKSDKCTSQAIDAHNVEQQAEKADSQANVAQNAEQQANLNEQVKKIQTEKKTRKCIVKN